MWEFFLFFSFHIYIYTHTHTYTHKYIYTHTYIYMYHTCTTHIHAYMLSLSHTHLHTLAHAHTCTHLHTHTHTHTQAHTCTQVSKLILASTIVNVNINIKKVFARVFMTEYFVLRYIMYASAHPMCCELAFFTFFLSAWNQQTLKFSMVLPCFSMVTQMSTFSHLILVVLVLCDVVLYPRLHLAWYLCNTKMQFWGQHT